MGFRSCGFKSRPRHQSNEQTQLAGSWQQTGTAVSKQHRGDVAKWLRRRSAKPLFGGSNPPVASNFKQVLRPCTMPSDPALSYPVLRRSYQQAGPNYALSVPRDAFEQTSVARLCLTPCRGGERVDAADLKSATS